MITTTQGAVPSNSMQKVVPMSQDASDFVLINQSVAILVDGNNIERSIHSETNKPNTMLNFDTLVPRLLGNRGLNRLVYFREGRQISSKLKERLLEGREDAELSRLLVTLKEDCDLPEPLKDFKLDGVPPEPLAAFLEKRKPAFTGR